MGASPLPRPSPQVVRKPEPEIRFDYRERLEPGTYLGYCRCADVYRDRQFQRWLCLLQFDVRSDDLLQISGRVTLFLNLGSKKWPHAGRRSNYFRTWVQANGGPPKRKDRLSPRIFERRMASILVADSKDKTYSVVRQILEWKT